VSKGDYQDHRREGLVLVEVNRSRCEGSIMLMLFSLGKVTNFLVAACSEAVMIETFCLQDRFCRWAGMGMGL
jgi:hypothetical protein